MELTRNMISNCPPFLLQVERHCRNNKNGLSHIPFLRPILEEVINYLYFPIKYFCSKQLIQYQLFT